MRKISFILPLIVLVGFNACAPLQSPWIDYENVSYKGAAIKNIRVVWNGYEPLGKTESSFCGGLSQVLTLDNQADFFGNIHVEWESAKGEKLAKDLVFTKEQLPSMRNRFNQGKQKNPTATLYFTQDNVYLYTSDTPNLKEIEADLYKKAGLTCQEYRDQKFLKKWGSFDHPVLQKGYSSDTISKYYYSESHISDK